MDQNAIQGGLKNGGREAKAGLGRADDIIGAVQESIAAAADETSASLDRIGDQARDAYGQAWDRMQELADQIDPFVLRQPYVAIGLAAAAGLLVGLLIAGRGPKIVYVRPPA